MSSTGTREIIEEMVSAGMTGLCPTCLHDETCVYRSNSVKDVIQCELFEVDAEIDSPALRGLCKTCDHASYCTLPGKKSGVWHCNEYR